MTLGSPVGVDADPVQRAGPQGGETVDGRWLVLAHASRGARAPQSSRVPGVQGLGHAPPRIEARSEI
jgi:hypothetical protein